MKIIAIVTGFGIFRPCICWLSGAHSLLNRFRAFVVKCESGACPDSRDLLLHQNQ